MLREIFHWESFTAFAYFSQWFLFSNNFKDIRIFDEHFCFLLHRFLIIVQDTKSLRYVVQMLYNLIGFLLLSSWLSSDPIIQSQLLIIPPKANQIDFGPVAFESNAEQQYNNKGRHFFKQKNNIIALNKPDGKSLTNYFYTTSALGTFFCQS